MLHVILALIVKDKIANLITLMKYNKKHIIREKTNYIVNFWNHNKYALLLNADFFIKFQGQRIFKMELSSKY